MMSLMSVNAVVIMILQPSGERSHGLLQGAYLPQGLLAIHFRHHYIQAYQVIGLIFSKGCTYRIDSLSACYGNVDRAIGL